MITKDKSNQHLTDTNLETRLKGRSVSRGVAIGKIFNLYQEKSRFYRTTLLDSQIEKEVRRFRAAIRLAKKYLKINISQANQTQADILTAHLLLIDDNSFQKKVETEISTQKINAEWAVNTVAKNYLTIYKSIADEHLRERYIDLEDVINQILTALSGETKNNLILENDSIVFAKELTPSTLIELSKKKIKAIITEHGGWTSHTFILAREMNLPAVTSLKNVSRNFKTGDSIIVDGYNGQIILRPNDETLQKYKVALAQFEQVKDTVFETIKEPIKTLDGKNLKIYANLEESKSYKQAKRFGAKGIGLYRSEFLFNQKNLIPNEKEQLDEYKKLGSVVGENRVKIRTFDLSIDQLSHEKEQNPALGLRAIRLSFKQKKVFQTQIRAILQAAANYNIDIVLPMISDVSEILRAKKIINKEAKLLEKHKIKIGKLRIGAMIEVPSAVFMIDEIVAEIDFLCLGTNDLVQYLLAVDRDNESVESCFRTLHPAVLRSIKKVLQSAEKAEVPAIICGEMAGSPVYSAVLVGLGASELSMNINSIPRVYRILSRIATEEATEIANELLACKTAEDVEKLVRLRFTQKWKHLFSPETLP